MKLDIYIPGWVIADGNYEHFREGETRQFALQFGSHDDLTKGISPTKAMQPGADYSYEVKAEVVFASDDICVIDFGLLAYSAIWSEPEVRHQIGDLVEGNIGLQVDPCFYFDGWVGGPAVPPLIYQWRIDSIEQDTTPWVSCEEPYAHYERDKTRYSYQRVSSTHEYVDVPPSLIPDFVLHCTQLSGVPTKEFTNASGDGSVGQ